MAAVLKKQRKMPIEGDIVVIVSFRDELIHITELSLALVLMLPDLCTCMYCGACANTEGQGAKATTSSGSCRSSL